MCGRIIHCITLGIATTYIFFIHSISNSKIVYKYV